MSADSRSSFRLLDIFPTADDITGSRDPLLRKNKIEESYKDTDDYLDVHFRLLREDFLDPWRQTLNEVRNRHKTGSVSEVEVYRVQLIEERCPRKRSLQGFSDRIQVQFDPSHLKELQGSKRDRFQHGTLVCLSNDNFETLVVSTIAQNRELTGGSLWLSFGGIIARDKLCLDCNYELIVNTKVCFQTHKHFLEVLQSKGTLPFQRYLLHPKTTEIPAPNYLLPNAKFNFSSILNPEKNIREITTVPCLELDSWPTPDELGLDLLQYRALTTAMTKSLAIIQGPPGTGKTKIGVKIVQLLLESNRTLEEPLSFGPIILLAHTNHALDQFLESIIEIYPKEAQGLDRSIFRIGGRSRSTNKDLRECVLQIDSRKHESSLAKLKNAKIIAMTTSGAAKYHYLIKSLQPKVVVVEEAAEILESHLVASLPDTCEHLILIGDHQQLRPRPASYWLETDYELGVSLFERLVRNNLPRVCLIEQRRMRPEIAGLLTPYIYETLQDHESVYKYEDVAGIYGNLLFIDHKEEENVEGDDTSYSNEHEAKFLLELCEYMLGVGYKPSQITILVSYASQEKKIRCLLEGKLLTVRIATVDNYQGEENDIILLSLVRSNQKNCIGFLECPNRVCVALSRARKGLYIIGNGDLLRSNSDLWRKVLESLENQGKVVKSLRLGCHRHREEVFPVPCASAFDYVPKTGRSEECGFELPLCGHRCKMRCHQLQPDHNEYRCQERCTSNLHPYINRCYETSLCEEQESLEKDMIDIHSSSPDDIDVTRSIKDATIRELPAEDRKPRVKVLKDNDVNKRKTPPQRVQGTDASSVAITGKRRQDCLTTLSKSDQLGKNIKRGKHFGSDSSTIPGINELVPGASCQSLNEKVDPFAREETVIKSRRDKKNEQNASKRSTKEPTHRFHDSEQNQQSCTYVMETGSEFSNRINFRSNRERTDRTSDTRSPSRDQFQSVRVRSRFNETSAVKRSHRHAGHSAFERDYDWSPDYKRRGRDHSQVHAQRADWWEHGHSRHTRDSRTYDGSRPDRRVLSRRDCDVDHRQLRTTPVRSGVGRSEGHWTNNLTSSYDGSSTRRVRVPVRMEPHESYSGAYEYPRNEHYGRRSQRHEEQSEKNVYA